MKKLVKVEEVDGEGLIGLMGERVTLFCLNYIYTGKLIGVNTSFVLLEEAYVVYDTGKFDTKSWATAERIGPNWYVQMSSIESFGILK